MSEQDSHAWPLNWIISVERRLTRLEGKIGRATTARPDRSPRWQPRDYMMAGSGIAMVIAAITQKVGWATVGAFLIRLYGGR